MMKFINLLSIHQFLHNHSHGWSPFERVDLRTEALRHLEDPSAMVLDPLARLLALVAQGHQLFSCVFVWK